MKRRDVEHHSSHNRSDLNIYSVFKLNNSNFKNEFLEDIALRVRLLRRAGERIGGARASVENLQKNCKIFLIFLIF